MRRTPSFHEIHLVVNLNDQSPNKGEIWATKYMRANSRGSRLKYWRINSALEIIGQAKSVQWGNAGDIHQRGQLQAALGEGYKVLQQYEALQAITNYVKTV